MSWLALFGALAAMNTSRFSWVRSAGSFLLSGTISLLVLEVVCWGLAKMDVLPLNLVNHRLSPLKEVLTVKGRYAGDFSLLAGRWRLANARERLKSCTGDSLYRQSNAFGAADVPRVATPADTTKKRVLMLGDSFIEGYMVNYPHRLSDLLEQKTGHEHLNFGINSSAPIGYWFRYKEYGPQLMHGVVVVAILPANDFEEYDPQSAYKLADYPLYRPYYVGTYPNFQVRYSLANINQSVAARERTPAKLLQTVDSVYRTLSLAQKIKLHGSHSYLAQTILWLGGKASKGNEHFTHYNVFTDDQWLTMQYSLEQIRRQAGSRPVIIVSLPSRKDLDAVRDGAENKFDARMSRFCQQQGIHFIPLLAKFMAYKGNIDDLYVLCDGHWSTKGEQFVADILVKNEAYRNAVGVK